MNSLMTSKSQRRWFQFSLRSLLVASFLIALFLGWWFRPFVIEKHRQDGSLRRQFAVCRDWRGGLVSHGKLTWVFSDGTRFETTSVGLPLDKNEFSSLLTEAQQHEVMFDELIDLITETIDPESWDDAGEAEDLHLVYGNGQVVVSEGGSSKQ